MTKLNPSTEQKIRDLGKSVKLQMDFLAAADLNERANLQKSAMNSRTSFNLVREIVQELGLQPSGGDVFDQIVKAASDAGSDAADELKAQLPKMRKLESALKDAMKAGKMPHEIPSIIKNALKP